MLRNKASDQAQNEFINKVAPVVSQRQPIILSFQQKTNSTIPSFRIRVLNNRKNRDETALRKVTGDILESFYKAVPFSIDRLTADLQTFLDVEEDGTALTAWKHLFDQYKKEFSESAKASIGWDYGLDGPPIQITLMA